MSAKFIIAIIAVLGAVYGVYQFGYSSAINVAAVNEAKLQQQIADLSIKSDKVTTKIETQYVDKIKYITQIKEKVVTEYVPQFITPQAEIACTIPNGFIRLHNFGAEGIIPTPPIETDGAPSAIKLTDVTGVVTTNYYTCNEIRQQLISLQNWITQQQEIYDSTKQD